MGRQIITGTSDDPQRIDSALQEYIASNGYKLVTYQGGQVYKRGGVVRAQIFLSYEHSGKLFRVEMWLRGFGREMGIDQKFTGAAGKVVLEEHVKVVLDSLRHYGARDLRCYNSDDTSGDMAAIPPVMMANAGVPMPEPASPLVSKKKSSARRRGGIFLIAGGGLILLISLIVFITSATFRVASLSSAIMAIAGGIILIRSERKPR
jgi:hypothetical protein